MNTTGVKKLKERRTLDNYDPDVAASDGINPMVEVYRGDEMVAMIVAPNVDRDEGLQAARVAAAGFGADRISLLLDAHMTTSPVNPKTGEEWGPGEMQAACHEDGLCQVGLITDVLLIIDAWRSGRQRQEMLPYHIHPDKTIRWVEDGEGDGVLPRVLDTEQDDKVGLGGIVVDAITHAFQQPSLMEVMEQQMGGSSAFGLTEEQGRIHADCAMAKLLGQEGFQVALVPHSDEAVEIIQRSMETETVPLH